MSDFKSERCVLCLDEKRSPVLIQCGHSFCNECLDTYRSYRKYTWANKCPICRSKLKQQRGSVKGKLSISTDPAQNPRDTINMPPASSAANSPPVSEEQNYLLEQFIAIASGDSDTAADSLDSTQLNYSGHSELTELTPMLVSDDDGDVDGEDNLFSDSNEDDYYYEDEASWDPLTLSTDAMIATGESDTAADFLNSTQLNYGGQSELTELTPMPFSHEIYVDDDDDDDDDDEDNLFNDSDEGDYYFEDEASWDPQTFSTDASIDADDVIIVDECN